MQKNPLSSRERKRIESESWKGKTDYNQRPATLHERYENECELFLLNASVDDDTVHNRSIINIGGGDGKEAEYLIGHGARCVVLNDIAPGQLRGARLRKAQHNLDNLELFQSDAENLPFREKVFDVGFVFLALHHFPDHEKSLNELCRVAETIIFVEIMNCTLTKLLNALGLYTREWCGIEPNRLDERLIDRFFRKKKMACTITYFFIPPYYGKSELLVSLIKTVSGIVNYGISGSSLVARVFGNIAVVRCSNPARDRS